MEKTVDNFEDSIKGIRLGAITPSFVDSFKIQYYGQSTPIKHLAITASEKGLVVVKPHDPALINTI
jgi:ribosome recycling factor